MQFLSRVKIKMATGMIHNNLRMSKSARFFSEGINGHSRNAEHKNSSVELITRNI